MAKFLTSRQADMLSAIKDYVEEKGYPPTVRELRDIFRYASVNIIQKRLVALEKKGYIRRGEKGSPRSLEVLGWQPSSSDEKLKVLPIIGRVAAGLPILAQEDIEGYLSLDVDMIGQAGDFILRVQGNSMIDANILDGDLVVVEQTASCENGDVAIALMDGEATVKRIYKQADGVKLKPENPQFEEIIINNNDPSFRIIGKVKSLIRKF